MEASPLVRQDKTGIPREEIEKYTWCVIEIDKHTWGGVIFFYPGIHHIEALRVVIDRFPNLTDSAHSEGFDLSEKARSLRFISYGS